MFARRILEVEERVPVPNTHVEFKKGSNSPESMNLTANEFGGSYTRLDFGFMNDS